MNVYSTLSLIVSILMVILAIYGYRIDSSRRENKYFFYLLICYSYLLFIMVFVHSAPSKDSVVFWYKMTAPGLALFDVLNLNLYLAVDKRKLRPWQHALLYIPVPFVVYAILFDVCLFSDFIYNDGSWIFITAYGYFWFYFYVAYVFSYSLASLVIMFRRMRRSVTIKERRQAFVLFLAMLSLLCVVLPIDFIIEKYFHTKIPAIGPLVQAIFYVPGVWYAISHYRLLHVGPSLMADDIIMHIHEMVILLGPDLRILSVNAYAVELLEFPADSLNGKDVGDILQDSDYLMDELRAVAGGGEGSRETRAMFRGGGDRIVAEIYLSGLKDRFGDPAGVLMIARPDHSTGEFLRRYRITPRQIQVIDALIRGESAREIAARTGLSERTVETHIMNIYNRLGVNNRIELVRMTRKYGME
ncbi:MAG: PAS domain-containing protein [Spirochaetes bacterium]|nr:PAS domain-containing protein [Spirochaetota bacterium]